MRVVFLGSGRFAVPSLEALTGAGHQLVAVVTQPDRESGRGRKLAAPPVKPAAQALGVPVHQPPRIRDPGAATLLRELGADVHVVVAYGQILPKAVLEIPPRGTLNVHASLLPAYRGAAPIAWAIVNGENETGVTTMLLDEGMDTGPMLLQRRTPIGADETGAGLEQRLSVMGAELLIETLAQVGDRTLRPEPQDSARASYAPLLKKEDGRVRWSEPATALERKIRGFQPWPVAATSLGGRGVRLLAARVEPGGGAPPGSVIALDGSGLLVACGESSSLRLVEVQPESRGRMSAAAFAAGARIEPGQRFD